MSSELVRLKMNTRGLNPRAASYFQEIECLEGVCRKSNSSDKSSEASFERTEGQGSCLNSSDFASIMERRTYRFGYPKRGRQLLRLRGLNFGFVNL